MRAPASSAASNRPGPSNHPTPRWNSKQFFLTYPHCNLTPSELMKELFSRLTEKIPGYIKVSQEFHKDGDPHLHVLIQLNTKLCTRNPKFFDVQGFHPNIQPVRDAEKVFGYISKTNGDSDEMGELQLRNKKPEKPTRDQRMAMIIASSTNRNEYLSMVRKEFPFDWAIRLQQFEYSAAALFTEPPPVYQSPYPNEQIVCPPELVDIIDQEWNQVTTD
ncbi:unnamed protein product [Miscanthus streak virus - [Japan 98]]|uniref:Replication-associated protein n=1 Tax=Miscanthus streak virus - [Japan 98] TaxID=268778 RepID=O72916_9GEMI|nr:unnamed protein product [Miscanthus streak virus - [Japan 98]]